MKLPQNAYDRALAARLAAFRIPVRPGTTKTWQARWAWKNAWVKILEAERCQADPRLVEIWKGEPHGKKASGLFNENAPERRRG